MGEFFAYFTLLKFQRRLKMAALFPAATVGIRNLWISIFEDNKKSMKASKFCPLQISSRTTDDHVYSVVPVSCVTACVLARASDAAFSVLVFLRILCL